MESMHKRQKKTVSNSDVDNIFQFVCNASIDSMKEASTTIPMSRFDTIIQSANGHWSGNNRKKLTFEPFATLKSILMESHNQLLTHEHHCLLLEEMMLLM